MSGWEIFGVIVLVLYVPVKIAVIISSYKSAKASRREFDEKIGDKELADKLYKEEMKKTLKIIAYFLLIVMLPIILILAFILAGKV